MTRRTSSWKRSGLMKSVPICFNGGAAGPGKTSYLLMAAVQYVQHPHYRALILSKTYADLNLPGAIMDRRHRKAPPAHAPERLRQRRVS